MKLTYYSGAVPNFGDELNAYVWPALLPGHFLDADERELFVGIGSIIGTQLPVDARKIVMGSGYAGYMGEPDLHDGSWDVRFVRGPLTAERFGLPPEKAVCDSAILLRAMDLPPAARDVGIAFMPHFESLERGFWLEACAAAGIRLIDATAPVETVLAELKGARMLITEAMHGAIVADALRTPWVAARPIFRGHHFKWQDWARSLGIELRLHELRPSSLLELHISRTGRGGPRGRAGRLNNSPLAYLPNRVLTYFAARRLQELTRVEPQLSADSRMIEATDRALAAVDALVNEAGRTHHSS
jgi:succinoglycan biosynthesis protein ExoV